MSGGQAKGIGVHAAQQSSFMPDHFCCKRLAPTCAMFLLLTSLAFWSDSFHSHAGSVNTWCKGSSLQLTGPCIFCVVSVGPRQAPACHFRGTFLYINDCMCDKVPFGSRVVSEFFAFAGHLLNTSPSYDSIKNNIYILKNHVRQLERTGKKSFT